MHLFIRIFTFSALLVALSCTSFERDNQFDPNSEDFLQIYWLENPVKIGGDSLHWKFFQEGSAESITLLLDGDSLPATAVEANTVKLTMLDEGEHQLVLKAKARSKRTLQDTIYFETDAIKTPTVVFYPQNLKRKTQGFIQLEAALGAIAAEFKIIGLTSSELKSVEAVSPWTIEKEHRKDTLFINAIGQAQTEIDHLKILRFELSPTEKNGSLKIKEVQIGNQEGIWPSSSGRGAQW